MRTTTTVNINKLDKWINLLEDNKVKELLVELKKLKGGLRPHVKKLSTTTANTSLGNSAEKHKSKLTKLQTEAEKLLKAMLKSYHIEYEFQKIIYYKDLDENKEKYYIVDFYIPTLDLIVELDGGYHNDPDQKVKDATRTRRLRNKGFKKLIRFKNEEIMQNNCEVIIKKLKDYAK